MVYKNCCSSGYYYYLVPTGSDTTSGESVPSLPSVHCTMGKVVVAVVAFARIPTALPVPVALALAVIRGYGGTHYYQLEVSETQAY